MALKRHHKVIIGSFSSVIVITFVVMGIIMSMMYAQQNAAYSKLKDQISELQLNTQSQMNSLSANVINLQDKLSANQQQVQQQLDLIKASNTGDFSGIINATIPSVVTVMTDYAQGTGFFINSNGYIVTNAHVLADASGNLAQGIRVITDNQKTISAKFIGYNKTLDIAVLKISGTYPALVLANSSNVNIGDKVIAIGNPLGLQFSVSEGIISAISRKGMNGLADYIQTDAALNPGNSGGPLINKNGDVVGINNFKITNGENLGFALESNYIRQAVNEISIENLNTTLIS